MVHAALSVARTRTKSTYPFLVLRCEAASSSPPKTKPTPAATEENHNDGNNDDHHTPPTPTLFLPRSTLAKRTIARSKRRAPIRSEGTVDIRSHFRLTTAAPRCFQGQTHIFIRGLTKIFSPWNFKCHGRPIGATDFGRKRFVEGLRKTGTCTRISVDACFQVHKLFITRTVHGCSGETLLSLVAVL